MSEAGKAEKIEHMNAAPTEGDSMSSEDGRIERIRADAVEAGDRIKAPEGRAFYEIQKVSLRPGLDGPDADQVELDAGWGSVRLDLGEMVERENWQVGEAEKEIDSALKGLILDLDALVTCINADAGEDFEALQGLGVETDPADDPETARDEASERLDELPLAVERTITFEVVIGTGGPDDRLVFECEQVDWDGGDGEPAPPSLEINRVLYRYSWEGSAERELTGEDKETAEGFARRVVPELAE